MGAKEVETKRLALACCLETSPGFARALGFSAAQRKRRRWIKNETLPERAAKPLEARQSARIRSDSRVAADGALEMNDSTITAAEHLQRTGAGGRSASGACARALRRAGNPKYLQIKKTRTGKHTRVHTRPTAEAGGPREQNGRARLRERRRATRGGGEESEGRGAGGFGSARHGADGRGDEEASKTNSQKKKTRQREDADAVNRGDETRGRNATPETRQRRPSRRSRRDGRTVPAGKSPEEEAIRRGRCPEARRERSAGSASSPPPPRHLSPLDARAQLSAGSRQGRETRTRKKSNDVDEDGDAERRPKRKNEKGGGEQPGAAAWARQRGPGPGGRSKRAAGALGERWGSGGAARPTLATGGGDGTGTRNRMTWREGRAGRAGAGGCRRRQTGRRCG